MLVDPRPYTYEYRKPRFANPTYQSSGLYGSLYQSRLPKGNDYFPPPRSSSQHEHSQAMTRSEAPPAQPARNFSQPRYAPPPPQHEQSNYAPVTQAQQNPQAHSQDLKLPVIKQRYSLPDTVSKQSVGRDASGRGGDLPVRKRNGFERFRIYENQQKPFNIISCYPKEQESNHLRSFPKLTLEDRLRENGVYHRL